MDPNNQQTIPPVAEPEVETLRPPAHKPLQQKYLISIAILILIGFLLWKILPIPNTPSKTDVKPVAVPSPTSSPHPTLSNSVLPTSRLKSYSYEGVSFQVPEKWKAIQTPGEVGFYDPNVAPDESVDMHVMMVSDKTEKELIDEREYLYQPGYQKTRVTLDSHIATQLRGCSGVEGCMDGYDVIVTNGKKFYTIHFTVYPKTDPQLFPQILASFKFDD